ncbi:large conductance mechanosensitive channel protein MscL [Gryllotalpicola sp.]|uniref:large conductance mechanosensitive channel protein MscL n=1 Tax=Gryllotalpicola sp. TaxID=1932787 RepID=UPI00262B5562|nr:large conductance mechanosensitive channel protein MscL [Gryllotalpicola sp.]
MVKGFREFISQGNVVGLATAVVIGAAFTAIVTAIVTGIINPLIAAVFNASDLSKALVVAIPTVSGGQSDILFGAVIAAVINFIVISAIVYFVFVLPYSKFLERQAAKNAPTEKAPDGPTQEQLLTQIRDLLAEKN